MLYIYSCSHDQYSGIKYSDTACIPLESCQLHRLPGRHSKEVHIQHSGIIEDHQDYACRQDPSQTPSLFQSDAAIQHRSGRQHGTQIKHLRRPAARIGHSCKEILRHLSVLILPYGSSIFPGIQPFQIIFLCIHFLFFLLSNSRDPLFELSRKSRQICIQMIPPCRSRQHSSSDHQHPPQEHGQNRYASTS